MQTDNATRKTPTSVGTPTMSSLPSNATTTTTGPLFKTKPMVLCQLVSPSYFETGTLRNAVEGQEVPSSTMCDYILLDLPLAANGSFEVDSYRFLTRAKHRLLFHVDIDLQGVGSGSFLVNSNSTPFVESVQYLQHAHGSSKIHGLGVLKGLPTLLSLIGQGWTKFYLDLIYSGFAEILRDSGVDQGKIKNFFAFNPGLVTQDTYKQHLSLLNSITDLNLVIILTITNERVAQVYPSSAWDNRCLPQSFDTTMVCESQLFGRGPSGASIYYIGGSACAFAEGNDTSDTVISFETPRTIRHKMVETYRKIGYNLTDKYVINWVVYNMTYGLAPDVCNGAHNRVLEIRKVIDENK
ncbi:uncharacterized protein [Dermacentor albipictus]|uniref:uncharacterized protein isoform X4 n=1 Tax=Dermacentor albipictus TaxID=60249 RepID=UPI0031FCE7B2